MGKTNVAKAKKENSPFVKGYLVSYNVIETIGWANIFYLLITFYTTSQSTTLYERVKWPLIIFQNAAILEIVHAAIRIVPSNPLITAVQVASRVMVVCGVILSTQAARDTVGLPLCLAAWSITEIIRYGNYACSLLGIVPQIVTWLRYSTFIILYPVGITGELLCLYAAQDEVSRTKIYTIEMPNRLNFIFNYQTFLQIVMFLYIPLFPQLYLHMWTLRRKVLGGVQKKKET